MEKDKIFTILGSVAVVIVAMVFIIPQLLGGSIDIGSQNSGLPTNNVDSGLPTNNVDYNMLSNDAELKKVYGAIQEKLGDNIKYVDEVRIDISRPSVEGTITKQGKPDEFSMSLTHLYQQDKKKVYYMRYINSNGWYINEPRGVNLIGPGDKESFRLEDVVFDMSPLTAETLSKIVDDAMKKYKDDGKYSYQYVSGITIKDGIVKVTIHGKLSANDIEKSEYYYANLEGVEGRK